MFWFLRIACLHFALHMLYLCECACNYPIPAPDFNPPTLYACGNTNDNLALAFRLHLHCIPMSACVIVWRQHFVSTHPRCIPTSMCVFVWHQHFTSTHPRCIPVSTCVFVWHQHFASTHLCCIPTSVCVIANRVSLFENQ